MVNNAEKENTNNRRCVIIAAAPFNEIKGISDLLQEKDYIIVADGGKKLVNELKAKLDYIVADFDSLSMDEIVGLDIPVCKLPAIKDDTDTMAAARMAFDMGFRDYLLLGVVGGRLDHTMANLAVMMWLLNHECEAVLADEYVQMRMCLPGQYIVEPVSNSYLSLIPYGGDVTGLYTKHVFYPLENAVLSPNYPLGISNEFTNVPAEISFKTGVLMIFTAKD